MSLLEVRDLRAGYGPIQVLFGIGFAVAEGGFLVMLGANGAGKTTTLRAISGILPATGDILYDGRPIAGLSAHARARLGLAHIPQGRGTFTQFTVEENLRLGAIARADGGRDADRDISRWFETFPRLRERRAQLAGNLSGGEQQMLAIARALMSRPRLLMCDEPSLGLAPAITQEIFEILARLNREEGLTLLVVEQNVDITLRHADTALTIENGTIGMTASASDMLASDDIQKSYLRM